MRENLIKVDSSVYYFNKASRILISVSDKPHSLAGSIRDNLTNACLDKRDFKTARRLFLENYHFYDLELSSNYIQPDYERWLRAGLQITETDLKLGSLSQASLMIKEMHSKKRDLSDFAINLSENQKWIKNVLERFERIKELKGRAKGKEPIVIEEVIKDKTSFNDATKIFQEKIDKLSHSFYDKLRKTFPELNESDIKLCAMIRLGVDNY